ncbi:FecCD family ABC transporter permease [Brevibacillus laterosporus]|uniref:FecCD family ABC transporter permease n=1 Tax=Brevibacillus laterosporus TaxID=1465 RepID=UPI00265499F4|nr:iron ABC transporter permease [Brevibacillus laterosporus]MDN9008545.1 iron ABC transporter permease [Brevibacillus laterosporus]MDO0939631.1 iron ABC transporter permease [Brevibacillus laterosporus]
MSKPSFVHKFITIRSNRPALSAQLSICDLLVLVILFLVLIVCTLLSIAFGTTRIPIPDILATFVGGDVTNRIVILELRMPRTLMAIMIGAALGVAGAITQGVFRNPLASPDLLGVTGGGSVAAVAFMTFSNGQTSIHWLPLLAIGGAFATAFINYTFAWRGGVSPYRLVLIGIGISTAMSALTTFLLLSGPAHLASQILGWLTGTIYGTSMKHVIAVLPWIIFFVPLAWLLARRLNVLTLGDEIATGLGNPVQTTRFLLILISVALAGAAVGLAGNISFIGLTAPHIARRLVSSLYGVLIPASALLGAIILVLADLAGRMLFSPADIPAGVFTAIIGAPFFLYLLYRGQGKK